MSYDSPEGGRIGGPRTSREQAGRRGDLVTNKMKEVGARGAPKEKRAWVY